jgi:uncharacterized protein
MIQRSFEKAVKEGLRDFPAVVLLGPRQVGKSTLAKLLARKYHKKTLLLDMERPTDRNKLNDPEAFFDGHPDHLIIIDEVQFMPELFTVLRPVIDSYRKVGRFLLLGSASPHLIKGVSESLAGRVRYIELPAVTITEAEKSKITANTLWLRGGFPPSLTARNQSSSLTWRKELIRSFVERDLTALFGTGITEVTVRNFWSMLAHTQGSIFHAQTFAQSLGVSGPTVTRYLQFLHAAYLVRILEPWFVNTAKRVVKSPKVYVRDSGLLHALLDIEDYQSLLGHPVAGTSWEGFVAEQVIQHLPAGIRVFFYRTHHGAEADLVLVKGIKAVAAIEIKLSNAPVISKGFYEVVKDLKLQTGFAVTPGSEHYTINNLQVIGLMDFIKKVLPGIS